jgi:hypothetical protein
VRVSATEKKIIPKFIRSSLQKSNESSDIIAVFCNTHIKLKTDESPFLQIYVIISPCHSIYVLFLILTKIFNYLIEQK